MVDKGHDRGKLSLEKYRPCSYVSGKNANHLPRQGVGPQVVVNRVG